MSDHARTLQTDIAIIGSGFSGALAAMALRRCGRSVVLLERGQHPRFAIGESSTPLANLLIEELADRYELPRIRPFSKFGTWRGAYPDVACGLKRGFSFFRHDLHRPFTDDPSHGRQLLVAASPHDAIGDTHWYRPDFDQFLVRDAQAAGAEYFDRTAITDVHVDGEHGALLRGQRQGTPLTIHARFVIDASGPRGVLHRALGLQEDIPQWLPSTQGLYTHFTGVARWDQLQPPGGEPPFPIDDAAVHHIFPGGWIWILRFTNGITSAGAAVTEPLAQELRLSDGEAAWHRLLSWLPSVRAQFAGARAVLPFIHAPRVAFRSRSVVGPCWALLPSAAGIIDPLLSTGFPLTLLGLHRLVELLARDFDTPSRARALARYQQQTLGELDATERLVAALYANLSDFALFKRLSLLYFAAASFAETVRRLGRPDHAPGFLLCEDPTFGPALRACTDAAMRHPSGADRDALLTRIDRAIAPLDVAGLSDRSRRDWYPVLASDLLAAGPALGVSDRDIRQLLARCGFDNTLDVRQNPEPLR
jgi:FADH2 O2-dependent halogenase